MNRIPRFTRLVAALGLGLSLATTLLASRPAQAEGEIRIAEQFGIVYLLLNVVRDQRLIEKHGQAEGLQIKVDWTQLSGGAAVNDALLSGAIDIAGAGVGPLLTIWDRTRGRQNVKAVASLGNFPYYLLSNDPRVRSIADFGAGDRIAVPAVGVSVQSRFLQYAAAKQWGDKQFDRLDKYTVALPHPDATAALVAGGTELTGHFSNPPFQDQALANPKVHVVLDSYELLGPNSPTVLFATEKFRQDNPKTYRAFVEALKEAAAFAQNDKAAAADTYIRVTGAKIDRAAHAPHQFVGQFAGTRRECRRNAGGVQVAGAEHFFADMGEAQPAGRRAAAEVLDPRVGTIDLAGLHLEPGGRLRVDLDEAAVEALAGQAVEYEAAERVVADPAQPGHREAEAGEADGDVAVGAGDALAELLDPVQFAGLFGDEHGHGLAEAEDLEVSHAGVPPGAGRGGRGRRCAGG